MQKLYNQEHLKAMRRALRNNATTAEATLWRYLQNRQLAGRKFRRQYSVGNYILDFYCPKERLAIELDGAQHFTSPGYEADQVRDEYLHKLDIRVMRFENQEVFDDAEGVLERIKASFRRSTTPNPY